MSKPISSIVSGYLRSFHENVLSTVQRHPTLPTGFSGVMKHFSSAMTTQNSTFRAVPPPNVVVFTNDNDEYFATIKSHLYASIGVTKYDIMHLNLSEFQSLPWQKNTRLLIIASDQVSKFIFNSIASFIQSGGQVLSLNSQMDNIFLKSTENSEQLVVPVQINVESTAIPELLKHCMVKCLDTALSVESISETDHQPVCIEVLHTLSGGRAIILREDVLPCQTAVDVPKDTKTFFQHVYEFLADVLFFWKTRSERLKIMKQLLSYLPWTKMLAKDSKPVKISVSNEEREKILKYCLNNLGLSLAKIVILQNTPYCCFSTGAYKGDLVRWLQSCQIANYVSLGSFKIRVDFSSYHNIDMSHTELCISAGDNDMNQDRSVQTYWNNLKTRTIGRTLLYSRVTTSTMDIVNALKSALPTDVGLVAVADYQVAGRGRGTNSWVSPEGCAMFSVHLCCGLDSRLGQRITLLQHVMSVAVIKSLTSSDEYSVIGHDLRLKWPNDVYYLDQAKIGGILTVASVLGQRVDTNIGCGINVANSDPTFCINDIIKHHNLSLTAKMKPLATLQFIALVLTELEKLVDLIEQYGFGPFIQQYLKYWLHTDQEVYVEQLNQIVSIKGIDDYGFLVAVGRDGQIHILNPDGNRFDMTKNLIAPKN